MRIPEKTGTGTITINVNYDDFLPTITNGVGNLILATINENMNIGLNVARVAARDQDQVDDQQVSPLSHEIYCGKNGFNACA
ncbi:hypothetical protein DPMN_025834 [Dreissena polymorpha]|uniref:Uncharacterized protein n=1 Tax=Dreissena polymorpha TaxID=45954 RepID=A0A9D4RC71_DREPO|nr:hypothetical protein DPMN_025834 [Dreissena polymorpha]